MAGTDPRFPNGTPLFGCASCCRDFASLAAFDTHTRGDVNVKYRLSDPETHHGFRCLDVSAEPNWIQNTKGRWTTINSRRLVSSAYELHLFRSLAWRERQLMAASPRSSSCRVGRDGASARRSFAG
jgi:hypothetical protein